MTPNQGAASLVERLRDLIGQYFDLGYAEGVVGRDVDTMAGEAQAAWSEIDATLSALEAENARLREALTFYRDSFTYTVNQRYGGLEWKPSEALLDDCGNVARIALNPIPEVGG